MYTGTHSAFYCNVKFCRQLFLTRVKHTFLSAFIFCFSFIFSGQLCAQVNYGAAAAYGLRKLVPSYAGNALQVRRSCDNATKDIGFTACGELDTVALKTFVLAANPLTSIATGAATAHSLRKLRCAYAGSAIRVRSSAAGSPTLDIGFTTNGDLDTAALKTFIGANSGFVTTWYDQSGNARHALQATTAAQPRIVNNGVIERQGNMPAIRWLGMTTAMNTAPFTVYGVAACFNAVAKVNADLTYNTIVNKCNANFPAPLDYYNNQVVIGNGPSYTFHAGPSLNATVPLAIWTYQCSTALAYNYYVNGSNVASGTATYFGDNGNPLSFGCRNDGLTGLDGWISEVVTFAALPSTANRQFLEWTQSQYYSTNGPGMALPSTPPSGFVSAWYDQSGNARHAVQPTIINQPRIINAAMLEKNGLNPAISFGGFPQNLVAPLSSSTYPVTISVLANTGGASSGGAFVKLGTSVNAGQGGVGIGIGNSGGNFDNSGNSVVGVKEWLVWCPASPNVSYPSNPFTSTTIQQPGAGGMFTYLNGTNIPLGLATNTVSSSLAGNLFIGGYNNSTDRYAIVKESEVLVFASAHSNTRRILLESNQAAFSNITISTNKYTPPSATSYNRFVNGVGRESATDSVTATRSSIGMGFIVGQTATDFLKDNGDYITAGINCPVAANVSTLNLPSGIVQRWANDWYINKTDVGSNNGTLTIYFDFSDYGLAGSPGIATNYELMARATTTGTFAVLAGTSKAVSGNRVLFTLNASGITNNSYYTIGTANSGFSPLPIELLYFDAVCSNNAVNISWSTATQTNNDHFTIERTADGINYSPIAMIKGAGTSSKPLKYSYSDLRPYNGTAYYRLKQTDTDGDYKYFRHAVVSCTPQEESLSIYPNPNNGSFVIEGLSEGSDLFISNALGQSVATIKTTSVKQELDLSTLPDGIYFIKATGSRASFTYKLIIAH